MVIMSLWKHIWKTITELGQNGGARCEQEIHLHQSNLHNNTWTMFNKHMSWTPRFPMSFGGRTEGKERSCKKKRVLVIILVFSDAIPKLCVHVTTGKHFTTQSISLQMEDKLNPCILHIKSVALVHECECLHQCFYVQTELADSCNQNSAVYS